MSAMSNLFLKLSAAIVATPITSLFNLSFVSSEIPKDWKAAAVIPLFKGGKTLDPNCYRPISILPCLSKVFENQFNKQITDHFESHSTFSLMQSGPLAVSMGVPQGSILGPTIFSVYINDVNLAAGDSLIHLYADGNILCNSGP